MGDDGPKAPLRASAELTSGLGGIRRSWLDFIPQGIGTRVEEVRTVKTSALITALTLGLGVTVPAAARPPHPPPPEAFEACEDALQGDACRVETPHGTLNGTCEMPRGDVLVCVPEGMPPPPPQP